METLWGRDENLVLYQAYTSKLIIIFILNTCLTDISLKIVRRIYILITTGIQRVKEVRGSKVQVAGHCFTITETTQTFTKMLNLGSLTQVLNQVLLISVPIGIQITSEFTLEYSQH